MMNDLSFLMILTMISVSTSPIPRMIQSSLLGFIYFDALMTDLWLLDMLFTKDELQ